MSSISRESIELRPRAREAPLPDEDASFHTNTRQPKHKQSGGILENLPKRDPSLSLGGSSSTPSLAIHVERRHPPPLPDARKSADEDVEKAITSDEAMSSLSKFSPNPTEMETLWNASSNRPVDTEKAAELLNIVRTFGRRVHQSGEKAANSNDEVMAVAQPYGMQWYEAQGMSTEDIAMLKSSAFKSGLISPMASTVTNLIQFLVAPILSAVTGHRWIGTGVGVGIAIGQIPLNALQQPLAVQFGEHTAARNGPVVNVDKRINYQQWLPDTAREALTQAENLWKFSDALDGACKTIATKHNKNSAADVLALLQGGNLTLEEKEQLRGHAKNLVEAVTELHSLHESVLIGQAGATRQKKGNTYQIAPRVVRPVFQGLMGLASGVVVEKVVNRRLEILSPTMSAAIQATGAVAMMAVQHVAAGYDEQQKVEYKNLLNLVYGDFLTEAGREKFRNGDKIESGDIDETLLRKFISYPTQSFVKRVAKILEENIQKAENEIDKIKQSDSQTTNTSWRNTAFNMALHFVQNKKPIEELEDSISGMKTDLETLMSGKLNELKDDGVGMTLLKSAASTTFSEVLKLDISRNITTSEVIVQMSQRFGQAFHMIVGGTVAASSISRLASAFAGGASHESTAEIIGLSMLSGVLGAIAATSQPATVVIKNNGRESNQSLSVQTLRGIAAGPIDVFSQLLATTANNRSIEAFKSAETTLTLAENLLKQLELHISVNVTTDSPNVTELAE